MVPEYHPKVLGFILQNFREPRLDWGKLHSDGPFAKPATPIPQGGRGVYKPREDDRDDL
jgi:hypothetical protein